METHHRGNAPDIRSVGIHPDFWYPMAEARKLERGRAIQVSFAGEVIVLARTDSGNVFALEDRCAHRQMPLSLGTVVGERIQCSYHGWCYDETGRCARVPNLPKGAPVPRGVRGYPCREAFGLIFIFPGDPSKAPTVPLPDIPAWGKPTHKVLYQTRRWKCHYSFMHENVMDMNHQILHRGQVGKIQPKLVSTKQGPGWIEVEYDLRRTAGRRHPGMRLMIADKGEQRTDRDYHLLVVRTQYPYQSVKFYRAHTREAAFDYWGVFVPADREQRISNGFGFIIVRKPPIPGLTYLILPVVKYFVEAIFREDRLAVEAEQRAYDLQGADWNQEISPPILALRQILIREGVPLRPEAADHNRFARAVGSR